MNLGDGNDTGVVTDTRRRARRAINGGAGDDQLVGGMENDTFVGGGRRNDTVVYAGHHRPAGISRIRA